MARFFSFLALVAACAVVTPVGVQGAPADLDPGAPPTSAGGAMGLPPAASNNLPNSTVPANYLLGPGDILAVAVEGFPQYSFDVVPVSPDGKINLTFFGALSVKNLTTRQVQGLLTTKLKQRMRNPQLTVSLVRPRPPEYYAVYVLGNGVRAPGEIQIQTNYRLTEALAKAGGLTGRPEDTVAMLTRDKGGSTTLDLVALLDKPSSPANMKVAPKDVLTITLVEPKRLTIDGDVARPGVYLLRRYPAPGAPELPLDAHLRDAVIAAGNVKTPFVKTGADGSTEEAAFPGRFTGYILRGKERLPLNIDALTDFSDRTANVALKPDDYVRLEAVPPTKVVIQGQVKQSGDLALPPGATVIDAIASAGGLTATTDKVVVTISRAGKSIPVDLNKALLLNDPAANIKLQNGDNILVADPATIGVTLSGEFTRPDVVRLLPNTALLDAIAGAGGLKVDAAEARISLLRQMPGGKQSVLSIDPVGLMRRNDLTQNVRLQDGDVVNVASIHKNTVYVMGEVAQVGVQQITDQEGLAEAIAKAGGPSAKAALTAVLVERAGATQTVDIYEAVREGKAINFPLQDGDYIVVPPIKKRVMVMEAVKNPDFYPIPEKGQLNVLQAITMAGGATSDARTKQIAVMRPTPAGVETHVLSLADIQRGDWTANTPLRDGDVVYVPRRDMTPGTLSHIQQGVGALLLLPRILGVF